MLLLLAQMTVSMLLAASKDSPTFDEPTHIGSAIMSVREHDLRWNAEHPPLVKLLAGVATLSEPIEVPQGSAYARGDEYQMGREILYGAGNDHDHIVWLSRLPLIGLTILFGMVVFGFARDLFGTPGAVLALAVYTLCPTILAHGRLIHTDVAVSGFLLTMAWFLWRSERRHWIWTIAAGAAFGLALASKFTALFAIPPVAVVAFWAGVRGGSGRLRRRMAEGAGRSLVVIGVAFGVLWLTYLAVSPALRFETQFYDFWAAKAKGIRSEVIDRLPVPEPYRVGVRFATAFDQDDERRTYLLGESYEGGRAAYFPTVLAMKTPLGSLALWTAGFVSLFFYRRQPDAMRALFPIPATILGLAIMSNTNIGIRHVAVVPMFGAVIAGAVPQIRRGTHLAVVLAAFTAVSVWTAYPAHLSYVNEAFGGSKRAYTKLVDSNVDWGQDLRRLADYIRAHPERTPSWIAYWGTAEPQAFGIAARNAKDARPADVHGLVAVSSTLVNLLPEDYGWIEERGQQLELVGTTILIYRVP